MSSKSNNNLKDRYVGVQIIDDSDDEDVFKEIEVAEVVEVVVKKKRSKKRRDKIKKEKEVIILEEVIEVIEEIEVKKEAISVTCILKKYYHELNTLEIGADEVGRGPMF